MARLQWLSGSNPENCAETFSFRITWVREGDWRQKPEPKLLCRYRLSSTWPSRQLDYQLSQRKLSSSLSSLDRSGRHDAHPMESRLQRLERREWWLWLSALVVTILSGRVFLLSSFPSLFLHSDRFFEIGSDQARWAILGLLLLFNICLVYRQWSFRRLRAQLTELAGDPQSNLEVVYDPSRMDPITGLHTRASVEQLLGKEVARARRQNTPLSLVALHLDVFLPARRQHRRTLNPLPGPHHRLQISHRAHAVHVYLIRSDHPVDVDQTAIGASRR
jgi:hypothetical protein